MEVKAWEYDEYPGLTEEVEGAVHIPTTGDEPGVYHWHDIPYAEVAQADPCTNTKHG